MSRANARLPPAALMMADDSLGSIASYIHGPCIVVNNPCTRKVNGSFRLTAMTLTWARLVEIARQRADMSADDLRAAIQDRGVKTQVVTNWVKGGRPIPVARYPLCAAVIGHGLTV